MLAAFDKKPIYCCYTITFSRRGICSIKKWFNTATLALSAVLGFSLPFL